MAWIPASEDPDRGGTIHDSGSWELGWNPDSRTLPEADTGKGRRKGRRDATREARVAGRLWPTGQQTAAFFHGD